MTVRDFVVRRLLAEDAAMLDAWLTRQPPEYLRFFKVFGGRAAGIGALLSAAKDDLYSGIFWGDDLLCVLTLRGWDEGFDVPAFGLVLDYGHRRRDLIALALETAKVIARLAGSKRMIAKIHPENRATVREAVKHGFVADLVSKNTLYFLEL